MGKNVITNFPITVYGKMEKYSDTISKGRCRVFYKGRNRNGTFITDEFAQKLIASAPYTPVKGIYSDGDEDYTDHGTKRSEGRIYGIVPAEPNFAWEWHTDADGKEREYACFDVLYYTALYKEAGQIDGKSESMELFKDTLKGDWKIVDGKKTYVFTDGCFLGLQALGDDVEPCFEGASFYSLEDNIIALLEKYEKRSDLFQHHEQGGEVMPTVTFKISDNEKFNFLFNLLNPNFNEAGGWTIENCICDVYDEYAIVMNMAENIYERVYYTKNDESDSLEITNKERCYIVDINEAEREALRAIAGEGTYAQALENIQQKDESINSLNQTIAELTETNTGLTASNENLTAQNSEFSIKIDELTNSISTLTTERDNALTENSTFQSRITEFENSIATFNETIAALTAEKDGLVAERDTLATYKKNIEDDAKRKVIEGYVDILDDEVIEKYTNNLDAYTIADLDKELTYEQKRANPHLFTRNPAPQDGMLPKDGEGNRGINDILARYEKK